MSRITMAPAIVLAIAQAAALFAQTPAPSGGARSATQLPDAAGRDVVQKVCGSTCHPSNMLMTSGRTRDQWTAVVNSMVARGAKASEVELVQIIGYLTTNLGPNFTPAAVRGGSGSAANRPAGGSVTGRGPGPLGAGAADSHVVDNAGAERGKAVFAAECSSCHGLKARGGNEALPANQRGPDLIRSTMVLSDRYGNLIGAFLAKGHPMRSGRSSTALSKEQTADLAHFLHQRVYYTLRSGPELRIQNVLTGNPSAGAAFFSGAGKCNSCHSVTGDLAKIGSRYDPPTMQMKVLFPRTVAFGRGRPAAPAARPVTATVTLPSGEKVEGVLDRLDDFNISLRDKDGEYRSFAITPQVTVEKHDPVEAHVELLDKYTDQNIHDLVAYLESLK